MSFFAEGKDVFYFDGRLYFVTSNGLPPSGVRGTSNLVFFDAAAGSATFYTYGESQTIVPFDSSITSYRDVAHWLGNTSRILSKNRLLPYARPIAGIPAYIGRRTRYGIVDGYVVRDSTGLESRDFEGNRTLKEPSSVEVLEMGEGLPNAYVIRKANDDSVNQRDSLVVPDASAFIVAGRYLAFTSAEARSEYESELGL